MANLHTVQRRDPSAGRSHPSTNRPSHGSTSVLLVTTASTLLLALLVVVLAASRSALMSDMAEAMLFIA